MKTFKLVLGCMLVSLFLLSSCKKDDDSEPSNYFSYNGTNYSLSSGYIEYWGENPNGSYDFDVYFGSSTIQYSPSLGDFIGIGDVMFLDLNTSSANGLVNGTYNYSSDRNAFTFVDGGIGIQVDLTDFEGTGEKAEVVGGSVEITVEGNVTTMVFNLITESNKTVTGRFSGTLMLL